jgi:predicted GNAT family N-acyltransferase
MHKIAAIKAWDARMTAAFALRHDVFVVEQGIPQELERDRDDDQATHLIAVIGDRVVGTLRIVHHGASAKIGRMAVSAAFRKSGIGKDLMDFAATTAQRAGAEEIVLAAQLTARNFYRRLGYVEEGCVFYEANLPHIRMTRRLPKAASR